MIVVNIRLNPYRVLMSWLLVDLSMLISWTMCRCYSFYNTFCTSTITPLIYCHPNQCDKNMNEINGVLIQGERGLQRVVPFQLAFRLRWTKKKVKKNVEFVDNMIITETIVLKYLHLKFFHIPFHILRCMCHYSFNPLSNQNIIVFVFPYINSLCMIFHPITIMIALHANLVKSIKIHEINKDILF